MDNKYTIVDQINAGRIQMNTKSPPPTTDMFNHLFQNGNGKVDWLAACEWLDTPEKTVRRWHLEKRFPSMASKLILIKFRGFLPFTKKWQSCRFDKDENIVTPYGLCRPSDIAFVHRYKWMGEQSREELKHIKESQDIKNQELLANEVVQKMKELTALTARLNPNKPKAKAS
jgi:hypothetical protein